MKVKALKSFSGVNLSMHKGQELDISKEQAEEYGHSLLREIAFLTAHSMLHLMGYDHMTPEEEADMFGRQKEILLQAGFPRV